MKERVEPLFATRLFEDFDQWMEACNNWSLTANQLGYGKFQAELAIAQYNGLQFMYATTNQAMQIMGEKPKNTFVFATPLRSQQGEIIAHNQRLKENVLFGLNPTIETKITMPNECYLGIISVNQNLFYQYTKNSHDQSFQENFFQNNIILIDPIELDKLKAYLRQLLYLLQKNSSWLQTPQSSKLIMEDCLPLLINALQFNSEFSGDRLPNLRRYSMIKALEEFITENIDRPLTLKDLCTAAKTNLRSLAYGVQDFYGLSPMEYLKIKRLNGVRRNLKRSDPSQVTVVQIAENWGFWSMGHFSRDYKRIFGELPSETLKKNE